MKTDKEFQVLVLHFMASITGILLSISPDDIERLDRLACDIDGLIDKLNKEGI